MPVYHMFCISACSQLSITLFNSDECKVYDPHVFVILKCSSITTCQYIYTYSYVCTAVCRSTVQETVVQLLCV